MIQRVTPALIGAALCFSLASFHPAVAQARTYERCDFDGDHCVRVKCDRDGDRCWRESTYYRNKLYRHRGRWVCDNDGDRCHYVYEGHPWNPRHWDDEGH